MCHDVIFSRSDFKDFHSRPYRSIAFVAIRIHVNIAIFFSLARSKRFFFVIVRKNISLLRKACLFTSPWSDESYLFVIVPSGWADHRII